MTLTANDVKNLVNGQLFPAFLKERERLTRIDRWMRWDHDKPHQPRHATKEYRDLSNRSQMPWLSLVVTSVAQVLYLDGYRNTGASEDAPAWTYWQANGLDSRQIAVHRAALGYGLAYLTVLPGEDPITSDPMPVLRGVSPRQMITFYGDEAEDDWPMFALRAKPAKVSGQSGYALRFYDDTDVHYLQCDATGNGLTHITFEAHGSGVCPVVRFANSLDLEGRADGEVEPFIPLAASIDQTKFDRLVVQRFASWVVRTIAGMSPPEDLEADNQQEQAWRAAQKLRLRAEDILIADDPDTKFGSLPATPLNGFIDAAEHDIRTLAAVSQTPAHEMLGQMANLSAEALAAAQSSLTRKAEERKMMFGEAWEQAFRLSAWIMGDVEGARDTSAQVRWRDMESRSLAQAADALGKIAQMLGVPVEMLWEKIPGWTDQDVERAKQLAKDGDALGKLTQMLEQQTQPA